MSCHRHVDRRVVYILTSYELPSLRKNREGKTLCRVRFIKAGAFAMAVRIAVAEVVAVDLDGPAAVFAVALPPSFIA